MNQAEILEFLKKNKETAYTVRELTILLNGTNRNLNKKLSKLAKHGFIEINIEKRIYEDCIVRYLRVIKYKQVN